MVVSISPLAGDHRHRRRADQRTLDPTGLRPHTLRHCYATAMLEAGANLKVLQTYLGHKTLQATEVYLHLTQHGDEKARRIVERLMNGPSEADTASDAGGSETR